MQVFMLHFAGGNCYSYDFLIGKNQRKRNQIDIEYVPLELPGRGKRLKDRLLVRKKEAIQDLVGQIKEKRSKKSYVIYGHSMGAILGISIAKEMELFKDPPSHLIVSGNPGPGIKESDEEEKGARYLMNDNDFKEELRKLGGIPEEILENADLFNFFSPILRADFEILENEEGNLERVRSIDTPIYALMGSEEETRHHIENWRKYTSANFQYEILPGDHFFIYNHTAKLSNIIHACAQNN